MGGFSSQVQQSQASQPSGKGGMNAIDQTFGPRPQPFKTDNMGRLDVQMDGGFAGGGNTPEMYTLPKPNQTAQPMPEMTARAEVMPQSGGGKGQANYEQRPSYAPPEPNYAPPDGTRGGKGSSTNSATSGQPRMGHPNRYANTIPQWDNASQQLAQPAQSSGKGKGG